MTSGEHAPDRPGEPELLPAAKEIHRNGYKEKTRHKNGQDPRDRRKGVKCGKDKTSHTPPFLIPGVPTNTSSGCDWQSSDDHRQRS